MTYRKGQQMQGGKGQTPQGKKLPARLGWGWMVTLLLFTGVALWGIHKLQDPQILPVEVVRIDGQLEHLNRAQLQQQVQQQIQGGFFSIDVASVREAVQKLPWVKEASVRLIALITICISTSGAISMRARLFSVSRNVNFPMIPPMVITSSPTRSSAIRFFSRRRACHCGQNISATNRTRPPIKMTTC